MSRILELPESVYESLLDAAKASGQAPADWIAARLPPRKAGVKDVAPGPGKPGEASRVTGRSSSDEAEFRAARARLWSHVVQTGRPTGADNESIDADLARAYGDPREPGDAGP